MKKIAIFCDGTWNSPNRREPTHVLELQRLLLNNPHRGQVAVYFSGIGTDDRYDGRGGRLLRKWGGGAFGWGLNTKVKQAYEFIAKVYQPGDEIYLFGFSRGAFTARSVAGMIRKCGIVADTSTRSINGAFELYSKRGRHNKPDADHIIRARAKMSPNFATSEVERRTPGRSGAHLVKIAYVGVWDTVGARGIPVVALGPVAMMWNAQYRFHDMKLSKLVASARHALALDERRRLYKPAIWDNLNTLNGGDTGDGRPFQQMWFIGNHGILGGSRGDRKLAAFSLDWIFQGAKGLKLKPGARMPPVQPNALANAPELRPRRGLFKAWRTGPAARNEVHPSVLQRMQAQPKYKPGSMRQLRRH